MVDGLDINIILIMKVLHGCCWRTCSSLSEFPRMSSKSKTCLSSFSFSIPPSHHPHPVWIGDWGWEWWMGMKGASVRCWRESSWSSRKPNHQLVIPGMRCVLLERIPWDVQTLRDSDQQFEDGIDDTIICRYLKVKTTH